MSTEYIVKNITTATGQLINWKVQIFGVNLSTTFPARTKCRYCNSPPTEYYYYRTPIKWVSPTRIRDQFDTVKKFLKRLSSSNYLSDQPRHHTDISGFGFYMPYSKFNPALHRKRGVKPIDDIIEILCCDCGSTTWAFAQKANQNRSDITNRKSKGSYPQKYVDWY